MVSKDLLLLVLYKIPLKITWESKMNDNWASNEFDFLEQWDERLKKRISIMT